MPSQNPCSRKKHFFENPKKGKVIFLHISFSVGCIAYILYQNLPALLQGGMAYLATLVFHMPNKESLYHFCNGKVRKQKSTKMFFLAK